MNCHSNKRFFRLTTISAMLLGLSACAVGPDYQRYDSPLPDSYNLISNYRYKVSNGLISPASEAEIKSPTNSPVNDRWWTLFNDETLNELVDTALQYNSDIRLAYARIEEADAYVRQAFSSFFPEGGINLETRNDKASNETAARENFKSTPRISHSNLGSMSLSYELDFWGRIRRSNEKVQANLLSSHYAKDMMKLTIIAMVVNNYFALRAADAEIIINTNTLKTREESVRLTKNRVDAGLVSPIDFHQAMWLLASAQQEEADFRRQRAIAEHQLAFITGKTDLQIPVGNLKLLPIPPIPPIGLPSDLIENRPDIMQAEADLIAANAGIGLAKAEYFPKFNLSGEIGYSAQQRSNLFKASSALWSGGLSVFLPIFNYGKISAQVDVAKAVNKQSVIAWEKALLNAYTEVRDALINVHEFSTSEKAAQIGTESARRTLEIATLRYQAGHTGYLELLDAERTHNEAEITLVKMRQARLNAMVSLFKALGGGWKPDYVWEDGIVSHYEKIAKNQEQTPEKSQTANNKNQSQEFENSSSNVYKETANQAEHSSISTGRAKE